MRLAREGGLLVDSGVLVGGIESHGKVGELICIPLMNTGGAAYVGSGCQH